MNYPRLQTSTVVSMVLFLSIITASHNLFGQEKIFEIFHYGMSSEAALETYKTNKKAFKSISLGDGTSYTLRRFSLVMQDDKLQYIMLWSKKNLTLATAEKYLENTKKHLEGKKYKLVYAQKNWSKPLLQEKNKPYLRWVNEDKTILAEMEPRGHGGTYSVFIAFFPHDWFLKKARGK